MYVALSYRCCSESKMHLMKQEGEEKSVDGQYLRNSDQINIPIEIQVRTELMLGSISKFFTMFHFSTLK
jgi:hypothetical protein